MFDIGLSEMILLAAIALIAIGPKQLPEVARTVGRVLNELKRATGDIGKHVMDARDATNDSLRAASEKFNQSLNEPARSNAAESSAAESGATKDVELISEEKAPQKADV